MIFFNLKITRLWYSHVHIVSKNDKMIFLIPEENDEIITTKVSDDSKKAGDDRKGFSLCNVLWFYHAWESWILGLS